MSILRILCFLAHSDLLETRTGNIICKLLKDLTLTSSTPTDTAKEGQWACCTPM